MGKRVVIPNGTEIVLIDTCTFINLEQSKGTAANRAAVLKVFELDGLLCISDLSFVELVLGCKDVNQLKNHFENLKSMEFVIFGRCDELQSLLSGECVANVINCNSLEEYKQKLKIVRNDILFPAFRAIFITYCQIMFMVLHNIDKNYWDQAFFLFNRLFNEHFSSFSEFLRDMFVEFVDDKKESRKMLRDGFKSIIVSILPKEMPEKYTEEDLKLKLDAIKIKKESVKLFNNLHLKKEPKTVSNPYIVPMMERFKKGIDYTGLEDEMIRDGINYATQLMFFTGSNFDSHDLIDLLNISMSGYSKNKVHYFTDEEKWIEFLKAERKIVHNCPDMDLIHLNFNND